MSDLLQKKCVPCEGGVKAFDTSEIHKYQKKVDGWEIVQNNKTGFYFANGNHEDLAKKIISIINGNFNLKKVSENANKLLKEKYDWNLIGSRTSKFYEKILKI